MNTRQLLNILLHCYRKDALLADHPALADFGRDLVGSAGQALAEDLRQQAGFPLAELCQQIVAHLAAYPLNVAGKDPRLEIFELLEKIVNGSQTTLRSRSVGSRQEDALIGQLLFYSQSRTPNPLEVILLLTELCLFNEQAAETRGRHSAPLAAREETILAEALALLKATLDPAVYSSIEAHGSLLLDKIRQHQT